MTSEVPYNRIFNRDPERVARSLPDAMVPVARDKAASEIDIRRRKGEKGGIALTRADFGTGFDQVARGSDVSAVKRGLSQYSPYTPVLTCATTNPTLGTGSRQEGYYVRSGRRVDVQFLIQFGTAGTAFGTGSYRVSCPPGLPMDPAYTSSVQGLGIGYLVDNSVTAARELALIVPETNTLDRVFFRLHKGTATAADQTNPYTVANSDWFTGAFWYVLDESIA